MSEQVQTSSSKQLCTFHVSHLFFGVEVTKVQEVLQWLPMTPVPLASRVVRGLINLRGQIVTVIDLRRRLGLPDAADGESALNLVVRTDARVISLLVDQIGDVLEVEDASFEPAPTTLSPESRELIQGAFKLDESLVLALNLEKAIDGPAFRRDGAY
ncbi:MAG: chemotaxis protein CheW [Polyangiaceae bacterium]